MTPEEEIEALELEAELRRRGKAGPSPAAPAAEPSMWERAREGVKGLGAAASGALDSFQKTNDDVGDSFLKGAALGLDDEIAALSARAGGVVQRQRDSDDAALSGGGESLLESWRATQSLGDEARGERRARTAEASERSPVLSGAGTLAGGIVSGMAAPGARGGRLAQVASGGAVGAVAGAGMGDAKDDEDLAADAVLGGALGAGLSAAVQGGGALRNVLRQRAARAAPAAAETVEAAASPGLRSQAADLLEEASTEGPMAMLRKKGMRGVAGILRPKSAPPASPPARPEWMTNLTDDAAQAGDDLASGLEVMPPAPKPKPSTAGTMRFLDPVDDVPVARTSPPLVDDAPAEVLTDLRRATLGRRPTDDEVRKAIETVAIREGTTDIATLSKVTGVPTTQIRDSLVPMMRNFKFRQAVAAGKPSGPVVSAADEAADMGRTVREARQTAQSPIDNVSGRQVDQVFAVQQQERWRAAYDNLPPEQRAQFIEQLRRTSGLSDDVLRQRLKMTKVDWRRTSFGRDQAARPVLRQKQQATAP